MAKMLMRDWEGRTVRLLRDLETNGGAHFPKGSLMIVAGHWRGMLDLHHEQGALALRHVRRCYVELVEMKKWRIEVKFLNDGALCQMDIEAPDEQAARAAVEAEAAPAPLEFLTICEIPKGEE